LLFDLKVAFCSGHSLSLLPQHYILIPESNHSPKILQLIKEGLITPGKSYPIDKTPTMYDPQTYRPYYKWMLTLNIQTNKSVIIENTDLEQSFITLQNWRNIQISKLTDELPNQPLIEYIDYLMSNLLIIKEELTKNPLKDDDITEESEIIGSPKYLFALYEYYLV
jgi:hypothetical protein